MLPIIIGAGAVAALVVAKGRPSTLFRLAEDSVVGSGKYVARRFKRLKHDVSIEMTARQLAKARRNVEAEDKRLRSMSKAQRAQYNADVRAITKRAAELAKR